MNNKIDNILVGTLWIQGVVLGTCFWFNTRFGFNLFSNAHWQYLATQQATRQPVSFWFYFSFIISTFVALFGLYVLIRPHFRKIKTHPQTSVSSLPTHPQPIRNTQHIVQTPKQPSPVQTPDTQAPAQQNITVPLPLSRPPRLNIGPSNTFAPSAPTPVSQTPMMSQPSANIPEPDLSELRDIFSSVQYVIKKEPFINGKRMAILAIGTGEELWMGATNISTSDMQACANKLAQIFNDTLDGVEININAFVVGATDSASPTAPDILVFDTINALRQYMQQHPNPPLPADDDGSFDAYSDYISTVIEYIGKL